MNLFKLGTQEIESTTGSKKMRLSENAASMVFQLFTKNVYSNPIGTIVREITSNCFDSHVEAKVNSPVIIRKGYDSETEQHHISFIDYGVGMSPDRVENIYGVYFESTKRVDNTQIGGFGIGGKTPLAYKRVTGASENEYDNSFYVITIYNNRKYYYMIYEGADSPIISLLHDEPCEEHNGTEIRIPVLSKDISKFTSEMLRQLYYFENIIFEGFDEYNNLTNNYQIVRGENFLFRGTNYSNYIHVCLGRVAYPIDYNVLGLNSNDFRIPVALKLEVGDANVTVSRESLDYSDSTIKMIKRKLELTKTEIIELLSKQYENVITLENYFNVKTNFGSLNFNNGTSLYIGDIIKESQVSYPNFKYDNIKIPTDKQLFKFLFSASTLGKQPTNKRGKTSNSFEGSYKEIKSKDNLFYIEGDYKRVIVKLSYLKEEYGTYFLIKKKNIFEYSNYMIREKLADIFNISVVNLIDDNGKYIPEIETILNIQEEYYQYIIKNVKNYNTIEIPESFIEEMKLRRKNVLTDDVRKTTFPVRFYTGDYYNADRIKLDALLKFKGIIFYGDTDYDNSLVHASKLFKLLFNEKHIVGYSAYTGRFRTRYGKDIKGGIIFMRVSKTNLKYLSYCSNAYHINEFKNKIAFRKEENVLKAFQYYKTFINFERLNYFYKFNLKLINESWYNDVEKIKTFVNKLKNYINDDIINNVFLIKNYYKIDNITPTKEQVEIDKLLDNVWTMVKINEKTLSYISIPNNINNEDKEIIEILKKIMIF